MSLKALLGTAVKTTGAKSEGIIVTDPVLIAATEQWLAANHQCELTDGAKACLELTLKPALRRAWFAGNAGRAKPEGTVRVITPAGKLSASFAAQWYPKGNLENLGVPAEYVRTKFSIAIKGDEIPENLQEAVVTDLMAVMAKHGCSGALTAKVEPYPRENFAADRHRILTVEQNEALEVGGLGTRLALKGS